MLSATARNARGAVARAAPPKRYCTTASAAPAVMANSQMSIDVKYALRPRIAGPCEASYRTFSAGSVAGGGDA